MFDLSQIWELLRIEPGHGLTQSIILAGIWWQSRMLRKDMKNGFKNHEHRIVRLEMNAGLETMKTQEE